MTDGREETSMRPALALASSLLVSLAVVLPWQAYQVHTFVTPYASAVATIEHAQADVVIVDPTDIWYGEDLIRNDPFLRGRPKVLSLPRLDEERLSDLCRRYDVAIFDRADAQRLGLRIIPSAPALADKDRMLRALARSRGCSHRLTGGRS